MKKEKEKEKLYVPTNYYKLSKIIVTNLIEFNNYILTT